MIRTSNLFSAFALALATSVMAAPAGQEHKGAVQRIKVHGKTLEGNLEGELADREVSIYLPPAYETARNRRYPVLYLLHGGMQTDQYWTGRGNIVPGVDLPGAMDRDIASGTAREMRNDSRHAERDDVIWRELLLEFGHNRRLGVVYRR